MNRDEPACREWVLATLDRYEGQLIRYATRITGDADRARDVVQDTFLRLWKAERPRIENHLGPWLFTVCRNRALDVVRKERRMELLTDTATANLTDPDPTPAAAAERNETTSRILAELQTIPARQQEVVRLRFQNGMSYKEISGITGHSVSNVGYLLHTAIKTLRRRLRPTLVDGVGGTSQ